MTEPERNPVEALAEEYIARYRAGDRPTITEYMERHPDLAAEIEEVFPAMLFLERAKPSGTVATPGGAVRGGLAMERLGDYRIVREIGRGGMGIVYEAVQQSLSRTVALKVLPAEALASPRQKARFRREALAAAALHHPNIVPVFGVGEQDGISYYVMERVEGRGLDEILRGGPLDPRAAARLAEQAARGLAHAHDRGTLHRDVKPANLLVDARGTVRITDFGLAKTLAGEEGLTATGDLLGTIRYMPPERFAGVSDERGDVYALGLTLYEAVAGKPAFADRDAGSVMAAIRDEGPAPPRRLTPGLPRDLETVILKAVARDPKDRYATAADFAEDLARFLGDLPVLARRANPAERVWRWCRRNRALATALAAAVVALLSAAAAGWAAYLAASEAQRQEERRREEAEANQSLSLAALESIFDAVAGSDRPPPKGADDRAPENEAREAQVLESVLAFYDAFAACNATNPRLRFEAARSLRRVGMIHERREEPAEAQAAFARAIEGFEALLAESPGVASYREELAATLLEAGARAAEGSEERCRRAIALLGASGPAEARVTAHARLASALARAGRADEARAEIDTATRERAALSAGPARSPASPWTDLAKARMDLAEVLLRRDPAAALALLDDAAAELAAVAAAGRREGPNPKLKASIEERRARALRALGREEEAQDADRRARESRRPSPPRDR